MPDDTFYTIAQWDMLFHGEFCHFSPPMIHDEQFMRFFCPKRNNNENPKIELYAKEQQMVTKPAKQLFFKLDNNSNNSVYLILRNSLKLKKVWKHINLHSCAKKYKNYRKCWSSIEFHRAMWVTLSFDFCCSKSVPLCLWQEVKNFHERYDMQSIHNNVCVCVTTISHCIGMNYYVNFIGA